MRRDKAEKTAVITGNFISYNYGGMAMIIAGLAELTSLYPGTRFIKTTVELDLDRARYAKAIPEGGFEIFGINKGRLPMAIAAPLLLVKSFNIFRRADLIVDMLGEVPNTGWFLSQTARISLARLVGTPYVIYGSSIGPFENKRVQRMAARAYRRVAKILVREPVSFDYLREMGIENMTLTGDNAFLMPAEKDDELAALADKMEPFVVFNAKKDYAADNLPEAGVYKEAFVEALRFVSGDLGLKIIVVPHDETDIEVNAALAEAAGSPGVALCPPGKTPQQLKYLISRSRFAIGSRIHFCIAAMSTAVPVICYVPRTDHRGIGMMRFFGLEDFVIGPGAGASVLTAAVNSLDRNRDPISAAISAKLPEIIRLASANKDSVREYLA